MRYLSIIMVLFLTTQCSKTTIPIMHECTSFTEPEIYDQNTIGSTREDVTNTLQGHWVLDTVVCSGRSPECDLSWWFPVSTYIEFRDSIVQVRDIASNEIVAGVNYTLSKDIAVDHEPFTLRPAGTTDNEILRGIRGYVIQCESWLVLGTAHRDGVLSYYRPFSVD